MANNQLNDKYTTRYLRSGQTVSDDPALLAEWDFSANVYSPDKLALHSNKKVHWVCSKCGYKWVASPNHRTNSKTGCPNCAKINQGISKTLSHASRQSIQDVCPDIVKYWDYEKNTLLPEQVPPYSERKVWLKCDKGHSYSASAAHVTDGRGCPYCAGKRVLAGFNDLATIKPDFAKWWSPKNAKSPSEVSPSSNKKYWWICPKGHEFDAAPNYMSGCPVCAGKRVLPGFNDLASNRPDLAKQWHPTKNAPITPDMVTTKSNKRFWWLCEYGHEWQATCSQRSKNGCPKCNPIGESLPEYIIVFYLRQCLSEVRMHEHLPCLNGKEVDIYIHEIRACIEYDGLTYHQSEQKDILKSEILHKNGYQVIRIREVGLPDLHNTDIVISADFGSVGKYPEYEWMNQPIKSLMSVLHISADVNVKRDLFNIISLKEKIKRDESLAVKNPALAREFDLTKNAPLTPDKIYANSDIKVWWKCDKGHEWQTSVASRNSYHRKCPICCNQKVLAGFNDLASQRPDLLDEWDYTKNTKQPIEYVANSNKRAWWRCKSCCAEWECQISSRVLQGTGCPICGRQKSAKGRIMTYIQKNGSLQSKFPDIASEWDFEKNDGTPEDYTASSKKSVWWICPHGHNYKTAIGNRTRGGTGCPICYKESRKSKQ